MNENFKQLGRKSILTDQQIANPRSILDTFPNPRKDRDYTVEFSFPEFTSLCPVTGQPDFATIRCAMCPIGLRGDEKSEVVLLFLS